MTDGRITVTRGRGDWERTRGAFYILTWEAGTQVRAHVKTHRALTECMLALTRIKNKIAYDTNLVLEMKAWENVCSQLWAPELVFFFFSFKCIYIF